MKRVAYRGQASSVRIGSGQWKAVGVSAKDVEWSGDGDVQEIADEAADYLAAHDSRFEIQGADDTGESGDGDESDDEE